MSSTLNLSVVACCCSRQGVTVKDVEKKRVAVENGTREMVMKDFTMLKPRLMNAIKKIKEQINIPHKNLLSDWTEENVLVDFTTRPKNKPYTLWIIDQ